MKFRNAMPVDIDRIVELGGMMHRESRFRDRNFNHEKVAALVLRMMRQTENCLVIVATTDDGFIIGGLMGMVVEDWFGDDRVVQDLALFIDPEQRGYMAATHLIAAFSEWAQSMGCVETEMGVNTGINPERTGRMFEAVGFRRVGLLYSRAIPCA